LHSSSKSVSISHALFSSMKDHDLKIYIDWHIQSKSHKRKILRFALN
jgi:Holliday junction resolvasome RuvABC ATP-dependent DNA helicase subunit